MVVRVTEMFYSIQGEGVKTGAPSVFVRLWGCNLHCGFNKKTRKRDEKYWECDSTASWLYGKEDATPYSGLELMEDIQKLIPVGSNPKNIDIIFTGGEPTLFVDETFLAVIDDLNSAYGDIFFETNGTIDIEQKFGTRLGYVKFNCSPKTENSGNSLDDRFKPTVLNQIARVPGSCFKFVVSSETDLQEIEFIVGSAEIPGHMVYLMPEGMDRDTIEHNLLICAEIAKQKSWRVSNRMQVQIWEKVLGV